MTTTKWTCDAAGNWTTVPVLVAREGAGWVERQVAVAQATATGMQMRRAA